jgi:hypothetical protein
MGATGGLYGISPRISPDDTCEVRAPYRGFSAGASKKRPNPSRIAG